MYREIEERIINILRHGKKAVLIYGARQIGKTYSIRNVLNENNITYFEINFITRKDIVDELKKRDDPKDIVRFLELISPVSLTKGESVIFLDEVGIYPDIVTKIKFLVEEGSYRYVLSGSMLGVELHGIKSIPIGYIEMIKMYPMNFYEFTKALNVKEETWNYLLSCFEEKTKVSEIIHNSMMNVFHYYLITGGMPEVVFNFLNQKNLNTIRQIQQSIINQYKVDFTKYEADDKKLKIISIYDCIPSQLNKQNTKFVFTYLNKELKFDRYENSFLWLKDASVAIPVYIVNQVKQPLELSKEKNTFKLFFSDVGLLQPFFSINVTESLLKGDEDKNIDKGSLYENFIAQELTSHDLIPYYFKNSKIGELDFLVEIDQSIVIIESKSGSDYKKHKSLSNYKKIGDNLNEKYYVFSNYNVEEIDGICYYPIYMVSFIKEKKMNDKIISLDIDSSILND